MKIITVMAACAAPDATDLPTWKFIVVREKGELVELTIMEYQLMERVPSMEMDLVAYEVLLKVWPEYKNRIHGGVIRHQSDPASSYYAYVIEIDIED